MDVSYSFGLWLYIHFYRPPTKLREGNVFSRVCLSVCSWRIPMWPLQTFSKLFTSGNPLALACPSYPHGDPLAPSNRLKLFHLRPPDPLSPTSRHVQTYKFTWEPTKPCSILFTSGTYSRHVQSYSLREPPPKTCSNLLTSGSGWLAFNWANYYLKRFRYPLIVKQYFSRELFDLNVRTTVSEVWDLALTIVCSIFVDQIVRASTAPLVICMCDC